jgi:predicted RNase H-like nuclease
VKTPGLVVGIDGARSGWVSVWLADGRFTTARYDATLSELLPRVEGAASVGLDLPIGLADDRRAADAEVRKLLHRRASSLFLMPPASLAMLSFEQARRTWKGHPGKGYSKQTWAIVEKVRAEAEVIRRFDPIGNRLIEVHPELSFMEMNDGTPLETRKWTWDGYQERRRLLEREHIVIPDEVTGLHNAAPDDVLDAAAAAWTAHRFACDHAKSVPESPTQRDGERLLCIWR